MSLDVEYIDGTKIESRANKYTFVWRKTAERNRGKVLEKIRILLEQIDEEIAQENASCEEKAEFTPAVLIQMISELRESLKQAPQAEDKETKKALKEKKLQKVPALRQRQGYNGLCLPGHSLQSQKTVLKDSKNDQKRG